MPVQKEILFDSCRQISAHILRSEYTPLKPGGAPVVFPVREQGLVYLMEGECELLVTDADGVARRFALSPNQLLYVPSDSSIAPQFDRPGAALFIDFILYRFDLDESKTLIRFDGRVEALPPFFRVSVEPDSMEDWVFRQIIEETTASIHGSTVVIQKLTAYLIQLLQKSLARLPDFAPSPVSSLYSDARFRSLSQHVQDACVYVNNHLNEKIGLKEIAQYLGLTCSYLSNIFHKQMGVTLSAYILDQKLQKAAYMLENTTRTVKSIAMELQFFDSQHFSKAFRKKYQTKPLDYRRFSNQTVLLKK